MEQNPPLRLSGSFLRGTLPNFGQVMMLLQVVLEIMDTTFRFMRAKCIRRDCCAERIWHRSADTRKEFLPCESGRVGGGVWK